MLETIGNRVALATAWCGELSLFAARSIRDAFRPPYEVGETLRQLFELACALYRSSRSRAWR